MTEHEHVHLWARVFHGDGCHFYESRYRCECGALSISYAEKEVEDDPFAVVWMDDFCERCQALISGAATPKHSAKIIDKDGQKTDSVGFEEESRSDDG